jgi:hypothetical protein
MNLVKRWWKRLWCVHWWTRTFPLDAQMPRHGDLEEAWYCLRCGKATVRRFDQPPINYIP